MTTLTPEKEAAERLETALNAEHHPQSWPKVIVHADDIRTVLAAKEAAEKEVEALRLAIMGGEDAPGYALSLTEAEVLAVLAQNYQAQRDRAEAAEAALDALSALPPPVPTEDAEPFGLSQGSEAWPDRTQAPQDVAPCRVDWNRPLQTNETLQTHGHSPRSVRVLGEAPGGALDRVLIAIDGVGNPNHPAGEYAAHKASGQVRGNLAVINVPSDEVRVPQDVAGLVEEAARIIDPRGWEMFDRQMACVGKLPADRQDEQLEEAKFYIRTSMAKAEAVLALRPSPISHEDRPLVLAAADNNHKALVEALEKVREQFRFYAQQHIAKTPPDYAKGQTNLDMVTMCDAALAAAQPSQQAASAAATNKEAPGQSRQEGKQP